MDDIKNEHALRDMADNIQDGRIEWDAIAADGGGTIADVMVNGLLTAAEEIESLRAENRKLLKDVKTLLDAFDDALFVRNTDGDEDPGWAMKYFQPVVAMARLKVAVDDKGDE